jgi:hypothetical protein
VENEGPEGLLKRASDPFWFQAFGCVLGFDWHSSGLTTTACGAMKMGLRGLEDEAGLMVAGGKGKTSRQTPYEIETYCERVGLDPVPLVRASKLSAKVDSAAVQDGFSLYHHSFLLTNSGSWAVVQQGMNANTKMARRYHWHDVSQFVSNPHAGVAGEKSSDVLNLVAAEGIDNRSVSTQLARENPTTIVKELETMKTLELPRHHAIRLADLHPSRIERVLLNAYEGQPENYTQLLSTPGVGAKGLRALALVAEVTYGSPASVSDPASFSWAHGGKDGTPFPVDRKTYDSTISSLETTLREAKAGMTEKKNALKRLGKVRATITA